MRGRPPFSKNGKTITLRAGDRAWKVDLRQGDFSLLRGAGGGQFVIAGLFAADFARLNKLGLLKAKFEIEGDWPVAYARLTPLGEQAIQQEHA